MADGGELDDGCVANIAADDLPARLVARARHGLPPSARFKRVLGATRERAMYNFNYEIDMEVSSEARKQQPSVVRVAVCAQEWQDRDVPDAVRYQLLWRAVSTRHAADRFRLAKNFSYQGHFPCALRPAPR